MKTIKIAKHVRWRRDYDYITVYNFMSDDLYRLSSGAEVVLKNATSEINKEHLVDKVKLELSLEKSIVEKYIDLLVEKQILEECC